MPSPDTDSATLSHRSASGRRMISQFTSPFKTKSRTITDFHVAVDDPHRQYSPGDLVQGAVHLQLHKPIRLTHLVVVLHGYVQVYKNPNSPPAEGHRVNNVGSGRGTRSGEYFGNGFASLFEDEVVLCGDGKLADGGYQFNFKLLFPDKDLPSSISFERGTISYMITATLTRPTTISPIMQTDHKVYLVERIDISQLLPPKSRTITLEPLSRRTRAKTQALKLVDGERKGHKRDSNPQSDGRRSSQTSSSHSLNAVGRDSMNSPSHSEISFDSLISAGVASQRGSSKVSSLPSDAGRTNNSKGSPPDRTITATVEQCTGGCLRGDNIPVRIHIAHTKYVKSLNGVIITLYRQARVDMHPSIPLGPTEKGKEAKYEDYYPKSWTGLGGLSLSGAGSSHVFRKDLTQTTVPLIIDPTTLTADINGKVQVPDEAFATISTVPGSMISFRYYVEIVLDIQGKLASQDRNFGNLGGLASTMAAGGPTGNDHSRSINNPYGSPVIDTAHVRRDKGVVACTFEVIVGTKDSQRRNGKRRVDVELPHESREERLTPQQAPNAHADADAQAGAGYDDDEYYNYRWHGPGQAYDQSQYPQHDYRMEIYHGDYQGQDTYGQIGHQVQPVPVPMALVEDESQLPEKERLRRAEERLLPSRPDEQNAHASSSSQSPTAPYMTEEQLNCQVPIADGSVPLYMTPLSTTASTTTRILTPVSIDFASNVHLPRTPMYEPRVSASAQQSAVLPRIHQCEAHQSDVLLTPTRSDSMPPTDDKEDLRRRQLEQEASAPPEEDDTGVGSSQQRPTAPALSDHYEYFARISEVNDSHAEASGSTDLPQYER